MPPVPISLSTESNPTRYWHEGAARLINAYVEQVGKEGKQPWIVYAIDGWKDFATLKLGIEGIVSKRRDQPYRSGARGGWLKIKVRRLAQGE
jgi:hypothetical protein